MVLEELGGNLYCYKATQISQKITTLYYKILVVESRSRPWNPSWMTQNMKFKHVPFISQI
jgi:hypothetical protein